MFTEILTIAGLSYVPLGVLIIYKAGRLRGLNEENFAEKLTDVCLDTIKEEIKKKIEELLQNYFTSNYALAHPSPRRLQDIADRLHQDSESMDELLSILKNMTELGTDSQEFIQVILYLTQ